MNDDELSDRLRHLVHAAAMLARPPMLWPISTGGPTKSACAATSTSSRAQSDMA